MALHVDVIVVGSFQPTCHTQFALALMMQKKGRLTSVVSLLQAPSSAQCSRVYAYGFSTLVHTNYVTIQAAPLLNVAI